MLHGERNVEVIIFRLNMRNIMGIFLLELICSVWDETKLLRIVVVLLRLWFNHPERSILFFVPIVTCVNLGPIESHDGQNEE